MEMNNDTDLSIWNKLHWFNFPDMDKRLASEDEHLEQRILPSVEFNNYNPMYVYMNNGRIPELEHIHHSLKAVEGLNKVGITFYLNEPLCMYDKALTEHTLMFYSEFTGNEEPEHVRADELDSIRDYIIKNSLTNVKVKTCDYDSGKFLPYYQEWMTVSCEDTFIKNAIIVNIYDDSYDNWDLLGVAASNFSKKFINLNWRWTPHRNLIAAFLANSDSQVSFFYKTDLARLQNLPWVDIKNWPRGYGQRISEGIESLDSKGPFCVDVPFNELLDIEGQPYPVDTRVDDLFDPSMDDFTPIEAYYKDSFCDVVTESRFAQPTANYSEKTHQPMWYRKPFIVMAPPGTLKYLHEEGYQTFSDFWDESYDLCTNHEERLFKIFEVIEYIESKSIEELHAIYREMEPILSHNRKQVESNIYKWRQNDKEI